MSVILSTNRVDSVHVGTMKDGNIAVITECAYPEYIGVIVTRYDKHLIILGQPSGKSWIGFFTSSSTTSMEVRILQPGEQLTIV